MQIFVRRFIQAFVTCWFFLMISSPFTSASLHALTIATPVALIGVGFAYGQRVLSCNCDVDVIQGRFSENCSVHGTHRDGWYLTQGGEWRRKIDLAEEPINRLLNRYAEDYVNCKREPEWLEKMCDEAIKRHFKGIPQPNEGPFGKFDYLEHKRAGMPEPETEKFMVDQVAGF